MVWTQTAHHSTCTIFPPLQQRHGCPCIPVTGPRRRAPEAEEAPEADGACEDDDDEEEAAVRRVLRAPPKEADEDFERELAALLSASQVCAVAARRGLMLQATSVGDDLRWVAEKRKHGCRTCI